MAERAGFEPAVLSHTAFRERHLKPLGHLSDVGESSKASPKGRQTRRILASAIHAPRLQQMDLPLGGIVGSRSVRACRDGAESRHIVREAEQPIVRFERTTATVGPRTR